MQHETFVEMLIRWLKGREDAVNFARQLWDAAQVWDDIQDEGDLSKSNNLFSWLAFSKEYDVFFAPNAHWLRPALMQMYLSWQAANVMELNGGDDTAKAYMLRAGYYQVVHLMVYMIAGDDWAAECGPEIYRAYDETLSGFQKEMQEKKLCRV